MKQGNNKRTSLVSAENILFLTTMGIFLVSLVCFCALKYHF